MFARIPLDPPDDAHPVRYLPRPGMLAWLAQCDVWLEARFLPPLDMAEAATLWRAGLSVDEVLERAREAK